MTQDNLKNDNQKVDISKPSNTKDYSKIKWLIIGAVLASLPTFINSCIDNQAEDKRIETQALIARQDSETKNSLIDIENLISGFAKYKSESSIILKNLMKSNMITPVNSEYSFAPDFNYKNWTLDDKAIKEKISNLIQNITPNLENNYFRLRNIRNIPLDENIMGGVNGLNQIILFWSQHNKTHPPCPIFCDPGFPCWLPQQDLVVPPKEPYKLQMAYTERLYEDMKTLSNLRKRIIRGEFQK